MDLLASPLQIQAVDDPLRTPETERHQASSGDGRPAVAPLSDPETAFFTSSDILPETP